MNRSKNQVLFGMILTCILILNLIPQTKGLATDHSVSTFKSENVFLPDPTEQLWNPNDIMPTNHSVYLPIVTSSGITSLISIASDGAQGNDDSDEPSISADGRFVAFRSRASNLVNDDTNDNYDIFVHDRQTGQISRVSVTSDGTEGNDGSFRPSTSADGRFVAFESYATNLDSNDTNSTTDIFVHDRQTGQTSLVSYNYEGTLGNADSWSPSISADGRYVAFSSGTYLIIGEPNYKQDVFVHDRQSGQTSLISVAPDGAIGNADSGGPSISADGRFVAFGSGANNLVNGDTNGRGDVFLFDRQTGQTTRVSVASDGRQANGDSGDVSISTDGRYVSFTSNASNLVIGDTNRRLDIFVHDAQTGETSLVSIAADGTQGNWFSGGSSISADGRYVAFDSTSSNLVNNDTNDTTDVFVHDRQTEQTSRISVTVHGAQGNADSWSPSIAANGRYVAYTSVANNLVLNDINDANDVFVYDPGE